MILFMPPLPLASIFINLFKPLASSVKSPPSNMRDSSVAAEPIAWSFNAPAPETLTAFTAPEASLKSESPATSSMTFAPEPLPSRCNSPVVMPLPPPNLSTMTDRSSGIGFLSAVIDLLVTRTMASVFFRLTEAIASDMMSTLILSALFAT